MDEKITLHQNPNLPFTELSYWLIVKDADKNVLWEGLVLGREEKGPNGQVGFRVIDGPRALLNIYQQPGRTVYSEWTLAAQDYTPKQLTSGKE